MPTDATQFDDGTVVVTVRSKRGTGTRDQDEVTVQAHFESLGDAEADADRLNDVVQARLADARSVDGDGTTRNPTSTGSSDDVGESRSKIYLGSGAGMRGWIPVPTDVVESEIVPVVQQYELADDEDHESISVNFTSDISESGWHDVDAGVVTRQIEPVVKRNMIDIEDHP
jgi:hypothetical protein